MAAALASLSNGDLSNYRTHEATNKRKFNSAIQQYTPIMNNSAKKGTVDTVTLTNQLNGSNSGGLLKKKYKDDITGEWSCPVCEVKMDSQHAFTLHIRQHNPTDHSHTCSICAKQLSSASSLDRHMLIHSGERPFKCRICNMAFTTNGNMHRHMRTHGQDQQQAIGYLNNSLDEDGVRASSGIGRNLSKKQRKSKPTTPKSSSRNLVNKELNTSMDQNGILINNNCSAFNSTTPNSVSSNNNTNNTNNLNHLSSTPSSFTTAALAAAQFNQNHSASLSNVSNLVFENFLRQSLKYFCVNCEIQYTNKSTFLQHIQLAHPNEPFCCVDCTLEFYDYQSYSGHACFQPLNSNAQSSSPALDSSSNNNDLNFTDFNANKFNLLAKNDDLAKSPESLTSNNSELGLRNKENVQNNISKLQKENFLALLQLQNRTNNTNSEIIPSANSKSDLADISSIISVISNVTPMLANVTADLQNLPLTDEQLAKFNQIKHQDFQNEDNLNSVVQLTNLKNNNSSNNIKQLANNVINNNKRLFNESNNNNDNNQLLNQSNSKSSNKRFRNLKLSSNLNKSNNSNSLDNSDEEIYEKDDDDVMDEEDLKNLSEEEKANKLEQEHQQEEREQENNDQNSNEKIDKKMKRCSMDPIAEEEIKLLERQLQDQHYLCKTCHLEVRSVNTLRRHQKLHDAGGQLYACHFCSYTSLDKSSLVRHLRTHNGERPYRCTICKYAFTTKANCERHVRKRHKKQNKTEIRTAMELQNETNEIETPTSSKLINTTVSEKNFTNENVKSELIKLDSNLDDLPPSSLVETNKSLMAISNMHLIPHIYYEPNSLETTCRFCHVDFRFNRLLRQHMRTMCNNNFTKKPFNCSLCNHGFTTKNNCVRHIVKQHNEIRHDQIQSMIIECNLQNPQISANQLFSLNTALNKVVAAAAAGNVASCSENSDTDSGFNSDEHNHQQQQLLLAHAKFLNAANNTNQNSSLEALCNIANNIYNSRDLNRSNGTNNFDDDNGLINDKINQIEQPLNLANNIYDHQNNSNLSTTKYIEDGIDEEDEDENDNGNVLDLSVKNTDNLKSNITTDSQRLVNGTLNLASDNKQFNEPSAELIRNALSSLLALQSFVPKSLFETNQQLVAQASNLLSNQALVNSNVNSDLMNGLFSLFKK